MLTHQNCKSTWMSLRIQLSDRLTPEMRDLAEDLCASAVCALG